MPPDISTKDWLRKHPEVRTIRVAAADLNGQARGKRIPARFSDKVVAEGTRFPMSVLNLDIWGEDIDDSPLVFETGDADGVLKPTERGFMPMPWLSAPSALLPIWMFREDGSPYDGDPRQALRAVLDRYKARGLAPVGAVEFEFFLIKPFLFLVFSFFQNSRRQGLIFITATVLILNLIMA